MHIAKTSFTELDKGLEEDFLYTDAELEIYLYYITGSLVLEQYKMVETLPKGFVEDDRTLVFLGWYVNGMPLDVLSLDNEL